jgi:hypothetical protein
MRYITQFSIISAGIGGLQIARNVTARSYARGKFQSLKSPAGSGHGVR